MNKPMILDLKPADGRKSFYGKAYVEFDGAYWTLYSYGTKIMQKDIDGNMVRFPWSVNGSDWSATTGRHIKAFCGMNKAEYFKLHIA